MSFTGLSVFADVKLRDGRESAAAIVAAVEEEDEVGKVGEIGVPLPDACPLRGACRWSWRALARAFS